MSPPCEEHRKEFEDLFSKEVNDIVNALYKAWLTLKWDACGTEEEAFINIIENIQHSQEIEEAESC